MKFSLIIIVAFSLCLSGCSNYNSNTKNNQENNNYNISRTSSSYNSASNEDINTEYELSSFSTKIYTPNDEARQNNIQLTCSALNETIVKSR